MEESKGEGIRRVIPFLRKPELKPPPPEGPRKVPFTEYLHILETYAVKWDTEKVARDTWQNFFDANGYSLDNVKSSVSLVGGGHRVNIEGPADYDYRYLLHTGGTSKTEDARAAGGFGEGAKVAALICLRDLGAKEVVYETGGKRVTFYMDLIKDTHYPTPIRGLFAKVEESKNKKGASFEVVSPFKEPAEQFLKAKDLFYHKDNRDFLNPTVNNQAGGFKIHVGTNGNLYEAGQRRHVHEFDNSIKWNNAEDITLWTWQKTFQADRDRGDIDDYQIKTKAIKKIVEAMPTDELKKVLVSNPDLWNKSNVFGLGRELLRQLCQSYEDKKAPKIDFPTDYVASTASLDPGIQNIERLMAEKGYKICDYSLARVGMSTSVEAYKKMEEHYEHKPNESEAKRIDILRQAVKDLLDSNTEEEIAIFNAENEKNIIHGQYEPGKIWMAQEIIRGDLAKALATFLHERDHKAGTDQSAEFSYALTNTLEKVLKAFLKKADVAKPLADSWDALKFEATGK